MSRHSSSDSPNANDITAARIRESLAHLDVDLAPSEAHGLLCGLLCGQTSSQAKTRWFSELLGASALEQAASEPARREQQVQQHAGSLRQLDEWFGATVSALNDAELNFSPLLPEPLDASTMDANDNLEVALTSDQVVERMLGLSAFCSGFSYGFGIGSAARGSARLPADTRELLTDFQAIESAADDIEAESREGLPDDAEHDLEELIEFVRVGVLLIHEECTPASGMPGTPAKPEVH